MEEKMSRLDREVRGLPVGGLVLFLVAYFLVGMAAGLVLGVVLINGSIG